MQANILWQSDTYHSLETCLVKCSAKGCIAESSIAGTFENKSYRIEYIIETNTFWETSELRLKFQMDESTKVFRLRKEKDSWFLNGAANKLFDGCIDIDIALSPFTNTLPIKRLQLLPGQEERIKVIYFDLVANEVKPVEQKYIRLTQSLYHYQNIPNDFQADIEVDEYGFVDNYPALFNKRESFVSANR